MYGSKKLTLKTSCYYPLDTPARNENVFFRRNNIWTSAENKIVVTALKELGMILLITQLEINVQQLPVYCAEKLC